VWLDRFFENPMLPKLSADAGYNTMHTGKYWMLQPAAAGFTRDNGGTGNHPNGNLRIDEVKMFNRALTAQEIVEMHRMGTGGDIGE
jgi:hypothetical protein